MSAPPPRPVNGLGPSPYLSIVLVGRNDDYGGDFNERFFQALRFNCERLAERGLDFEVVFVEWRPVTAKPYLAELLAELPDPVRSRLRSYVVDARYHDAFSLNPRLEFQEFIAKNVGIRRARGAFVLSSNTDIYLGEAVADWLARRELEAGLAYRALRIDLKLGTDLTGVSWALLEDERNWEPRKRAHLTAIAQDAPGDFLLLDRASYHRLRGFNEIYRAARIAGDMNFCVKLHANGYPTVEAPGPVYHLSHVGSYMVMKDTWRDRPAEAPYGDVRWNWTVIYENGEDWGLARAPTRPLAGPAQHLDFCWDAVPPLVDLKRLRLPAARVGQHEIITRDSTKDAFYRRAGSDVRRVPPVRPEAETIP